MKRVFSTVLFRYISLQFLLWFSVVFFGLAFLVWTIEVVELLRRAASKMDAGFFLVLQMAFLKLPGSIQKIFPFTILFASLITFMKFSKSSELSIFRAAGISVWQFLFPAVFVALLIGYMNIFLLNPIGSAMAQKYDALDSKFLKQQQNIIDVSQTGLWLKEVSDDRISFFHAKSISSDLSTFQKVTAYFIYDFTLNIERIDAVSATLKDDHLAFTGAFKHRKDGPPIPLDNFKIKTKINQNQIKDSFVKPSSISFWKLPKFIKVLEKTGLPNMRHKLYFQMYLAQPFSFVVMVLIGVLFSVKHHRFVNIFQMVLMGILAGVSFFILQDFLFALGLSENIPIFIAAWAPQLMGISIAIPFIIHREDG